MQRFLHLIRRFQSDERGAFLAIFGVLAVVLIAVSGAVVDYTAVAQARTRAQVALDAAALALQPKIYVAGYDIQAAAAALLANRIADSRITSSITGVSTDLTQGELTLNARMSVPTYFVRLVGIETLNIAMKSQATRKKLNLEVVMVLDNSGSMEDSRNGWAMRMSRLKTAANNAVDTIFGGAATQPNVYMGIVPFNALVNVGTGNSAASWLDQSGISPIANDNFDDDSNEGTAYSGAVNRLGLYSAINNVSWAGCVEARQTPYDTNDVTPTSATPATLIVPQFAPDEPDGWNNSYLSDTPSACNSTGTCTYTQTTNYCTSSGTCYGSSSYNGVVSGPGGSASCSCSTSGSYSQTLEGSGFWHTRTRTYTCPYTYSGGSISNRELQERLCKYTGNASTSGGRGPNYACVDTPILPLTNVAANVTSRINAMSADGNTNIAQGAVWGFRVLSPGAPFTQGKAYNSSGLSKVMIIMTDGDNTENYQSYSSNMNGSYYHAAYGYRWNGRISGGSSGQLTAEMDTRTLATCTNAKAAGITIYTIGLSSTTSSSIDMLRACASDTGKAYFPANSSDLDSVFSEIANQLSLLRLSL